MNCYYCGKELKKSEQEDYCCSQTERVFCEECFDRHFDRCDHCGRIDYSEAFSEHDDEVYCEYCFNELFTICDNCGETIHRDSAVECNDRTYCEYCFNELFTICDNCGETVHRDEGYAIDYGYLCSSCYDNSRNITDYRKTIARFFCRLAGEKPVLSPVNSDKLCFLGVELEVECNRNEKDDIARTVKEFSSLIECKEDGSLDEGFEIVTQPMTLDFHKKSFRWHEILQSLKDDGCTSHDTSTCGIHVHINNSFLGSSEMSVTISQYKLLKFFEKFRSEITVLSRRKDFHYCRFEENPITLAEVCRLKDGGARYKAVNLTNTQTTEFRIFRGTLKETSFLAILEFVSSIASFCKSLNCLQVNDCKWSDFKEFAKKNKNLNLVNYLNERGI